MKILLNENIPLAAAEALCQLGHDVLWARTAMPGASDPQVLDRANVEGRLLVTFDKDFGELVYRKGMNVAGVVLFRTGQPSATAVAANIVRALRTRDDWAGHFSVIEPGRVRMTPLPEAGDWS